VVLLLMLQLADLTLGSMQVPPVLLPPQLSPHQLTNHHQYHQQQGQQQHWQLVAVVVVRLSQLPQPPPVLLQLLLPVQVGP